MQIRDDLQRNIYWTYAEAAKYAGLSVRRIRNLASEVLDGRRLWKPGLRVDPYKVDAQSFMEFCRTGEVKGQ